MEMLKARNAEGSASLSRTMVWLAFLTCTGIIIWYAYKLQLDWDMFGLYLVTMVGAYQGTSYQTRKVEEKKIEAAAPDTWPAGENTAKDPVNTDKMP
jgi:hypothetical protein